MAQLAAAVLLMSLSSAPMGAAAEYLTPYQRGLNLQYGLEMGRIRRCDAGAQPNCVSTSNGARPQLYLPPFLARGENAVEAMDALEAALRAMYPGEKDAVVLVDEQAVDADMNAKRGLYRRWAVPSALVNTDYVEVYINEELIVFYRSQGSATKYIWPIQQPVSDLDAQKKTNDSVAAGGTEMEIDRRQLRCGRVFRFLVSSVSRDEKTRGTAG